MKRFFIFALLVALCSPLFGQTKKFSTDSLRVNNFFSVALPVSAFSGFGDGILGSMGIIILSDTTDASTVAILANVGGNVWFVTGQTGSGTTPNFNFVVGADAVLHINSDNNLGVGGQATFGTNAENVIGIPNGTAPSTSPANMVQLYSEDEGGSSELKVRDEAGNVTVLSDLSDGGSGSGINVNAYKTAMAWFSPSSGGADYAIEDIEELYYFDSASPESLHYKCRIDDAVTSVDSFSIWVHANSTAGDSGGYYLGWYSRADGEATIGTFTYVTGIKDLGTTANRTTRITFTGLSGIAAGDVTQFVLRRNPSIANDVAVDIAFEGHKLWTQ